MARAWDLTKETFKNWSEDDVTEHAAALAYYAIFSIAPLLLIAIYIAGVVYGRQEAQAQLLGQVRQAVGEQGAGIVSQMIAAANKPGAGITATVIGLVTLLLGASKIFNQLKTMLNKIWDVEAPEEGFIQGFVKRKLMAFLMVLLFGVLFLALIVASTILSAMIETLSQQVGGAKWLWEGANVILTIGIFTLLFAMIFKWLPDLKIQWSDVWVGAAVTAVLFAIGRFLIGLYFSMGNVASPYGAAGSLVILLLFIYYSAIIFFTGAEFTQVYATRYGSLRDTGGGRRVKESRPEGRRLEAAPAVSPAGRVAPAGMQTAPSGGKLFLGLAAFVVWRRLFGRGTGA